MLLTLASTHVLKAGRKVIRKSLSVICSNEIKTIENIQTTIMD